MVMPATPADDYDWNWPAEIFAATARRGLPEDDGSQVPPEEFAAMAVRLRPFPADSAEVVSGWARTHEEVIMWCGRPAAPVPAGQINAWAREDGVQPFGLYRDGRLVAYGKLWIDDDEAEVELARLIVDPRERGQGLGRRLVMALAALARSRHPRVFLRVHPDNVAARRCYAGTGLEPVAPHLAALWNASQPIEYVWLSLAT
jgi:ribosomal protein S18 acetylase RimI-like enzyme